MTWHVDDDLWRRYAGGQLEPILEDSIDTHVQACATCQAAASSHAAGLPIDAVWAAVAVRVAEPSPTLGRRVARAAGFSDADAALLSASSLALPWSLAVAAALASAVAAAALPAFSDAAFVLLAPLVPVLAVVAAFDATDPLRELQTVTPYSKLRLALLRAGAAIAVALPVTLAVGLVVPGLRPLAFVWLLPSLALTAGTLLALTWLTAWRAGVVVAASWTLVVVAFAGADHLAALTGIAGTLVLVAVAGSLGAAFTLRSSTARLRGGY